MSCGAYDCWLLRGADKLLGGKERLSEMASKCKTASDVKHYLHGNVYHPRKQRIISFIQVSKTEPSKNPLKKKDNCHYLCLFANVGKPYEPSLARYIRCPNNEDVFEQRRLWNLTELSKVDGKQSSCSGNFELCFDSPFKFEAKNSQEKEKFIEDIADALKKLTTLVPPEFIDVNITSNDAVRKIASKRSQLERTKQELVERGQKLSDIEQKTAEMAGSAETFAESAQKLAHQHQ